MKVLGMGNALVDVLALIDNDTLLSQLELPKGSMQLIDEQKKEALHKAMENMDTFLASGGSASNTITGIAKLGIGTGFIGRVGKDFYGNYYKEDLEGYNVKSQLIVCNESSGVATTFVSKDGQRTFGTYLGAAAGLSAEDLNSEDFAGYDYFYIEGYLVQNLSLIRKAILLAKENGLKVVLDMASYNVVEASRDFLLEIIPEYVDIIFANEEEAKALCNTEPEEALEQIAGMVDIAIVKIGEKGSFIKRGDEKVFVPALKVNCIDTTGAGDLYAAGFLYGLINNMSLEEAGEVGTLLAGNVIQGMGPKMDSEKWDELIAIVKK
ncbi:adenosine kinase [Dysgonomonas macrotermitis]|uniref:Sugar or nucleoside kinase, ribokinase family n=1 Tax=Dysgonomonas macrotermitis TaxID=1346286 RepID=A0A1M5ICM5_9BACT|nr:adenosine kinase [Dysgonomonas macrotermitis]SHG25997.1 Sugar or nucleoside kinase, ribokinase family [Dysgonomonas macrotermitis]